MHQALLYIDLTEPAVGKGEILIARQDGAQRAGGHQKQAEGRALRIALVMATWDRASATM